MCVWSILEKVRYSKRCVIQNGVLLKRCVIRKVMLFNMVCYWKGVLFTKGVLNYTPWVAKWCVIQMCVNQRCVKNTPECVLKKCFQRCAKITHLGVFLTHHFLEYIIYIYYYIKTLQPEDWIMLNITKPIVNKIK